MYGLHIHKIQEKFIILTLPLILKFRLDTMTSLFEVQYNQLINMHIKITRIGSNIISFKPVILELV